MLEYVPNFLETKLAEAYFQELYSSLKWTTQHFKIFGRVVEEPRRVAWEGRRGTSYRYSKAKMEGHGFSGIVNSLKHECEEVAQHPFNFVLCNLYRDGDDYMGWHRDNERSLGERPIIASLSFGVARDFLMRPYPRGDNETIVLSTGSLLIMSGEHLLNWEHSLPKRPRVNEARINLTFRALTPV